MVAREETRKITLFEQCEVPKHDVKPHSRDYLFRRVIWAARAWDCRRLQQPPTLHMVRGTSRGWCHHTALREISLLDLIWQQHLQVTVGGQHTGIKLSPEASNSLCVSCSVAEIKNFVKIYFSPECSSEAPETWAALRTASLKMAHPLEYVSSKAM